MQSVREEITEEDYKRYVKMSHEDFYEEITPKLPDAWVMGYGWYGCIPVKIDGKFFLQHTIGDSCD